MERKFTEQELNDFLSKELERLEPFILDHFQNNIVFGSCFEKCHRDDCE